MDSPERNLTITPAEVQGSPLFNFLCSLSPIKPVKSVHVAQTFSELSFPPPPAVFVSPRVDTQKDSSLQRDNSNSRVELVQAGSSSCQVNLQTDTGKVCLNLVRKAQKLGCPKKMKDVQDKEASPCSSPSKLVEQYLAEPVEEDIHAMDESGLSTISNTCDTRTKTFEPAFMNVDGTENVDCKFATKGELTTSSLASLKLSENDGGMVRTKSELKEDLQDSQVMNSVKEASSVALHLSSQEKNEEGLELDQESSDFVLLLSEGSEIVPAQSCVDDYHNQTTAALSELSIQHMAGYLATMREIVNEEPQEEEMDALSTHLTTDELGDRMTDVPGTCKHTGEQEAVLATCDSNVDIPPQRGVRRRCLDFEVAEAQRKSKNGICSIKTVCSNSNTGSQVGHSCDLDSNIPLSVLRERAAATSDATNSESIHGLDTCTQICSRIDGGGSTKIARMNSTMLRLSRCSSLSLKDPENLSTKPDSQIVCVPRPSGTSPLPVGMPSGIGLHLNSLTGSMSFSQSSRENDGPGVSAGPHLGIAPLSGLQESPSESYGNCVLAVSSGSNLQAGSTASFRQGLVVSLVEKTRMDEHDVQSEGSDQIVGARKSMTCFRSVTLGIKQLEENSHSGGLEKKPSPLGRKRVLLQDFPRQLDLDGPEDSCQSPHSPKKKRKSVTTLEKSGDGCKRCNCKKSKCLKLYCECFAAGVYCVDSCTCHDCFNKPEYEETVLGTRQLIESRNPLAFAPKIIRAADSSPTDGEECADTPASARHKRGCNCKKSQCLKKYCECFQAGVGCSDGCRCESCKNVYGRKEGSDEPGQEGKDPLADILDKERLEEQIETSDFHNGFSHASQQQNNDMSPITPSFQYSGQSRSAVKLRSATKKCFPSEELHSPAFALSSAKPPRSPSRLLRSSKGVQSNSSIASTGVQQSNTTGSPISTPKMLRIGQFSPRWDGLGDICTLTPLPQAPLRPTPASTSVLEGPDSSPSFNGQHCNDLSTSANGSVRTSSKYSHGSSPGSQHPASQPLVSGHHFQTPVNVQRAPMTPIFSSPLCISAGKCGYEDSDVFCHSAEDDSTPEFLKDPDEASSPVRVFKASSPKQKRVSPPHHQVARESSSRGVRSPGLRSSRKFILQSIPSVPPTPFFDCP